MTNQKPVLTVSAEHMLLGGGGGFYQYGAITEKALALVEAIWVSQGPDPVKKYDNKLKYCGGIY